MRMYVIDGLEMNRNEFQAFLLETIEENNLYYMDCFMAFHDNGGCCFPVPIEWLQSVVYGRVRLAPYRIARAIFGAEKVYTYEK